MRHKSFIPAARMAAACVFIVLTAAVGAAEEIDVQVTAIRGTNANTTVSAELKSVEADLKKQFKLTGFQQLKRANGKASDTKPYVTEVTEKYKASVTAIERKEKRITLKLEITKEKSKPDAKEGEKKDKKDAPGKDEKGGTEKGKDGKDEKKPGCVTSTEFTIDAGKSQFVSVPYPGAPDDLLIIAVSAK